MKRSAKLLTGLKGLNSAIMRFPLTSVFLLAAAVINAVSIQTQKDNIKLLFTCVISALLFAVLQTVYERFFSKLSSRLILMGCGAALTVGYYLIILPAPKFSTEIYIRSSVALLALIIAFLWIPVIKNRFTFNESFMTAFKYSFLSLFYSIVIFLGLSLIFATVDQLIINISNKAFGHTANIIFILFAPIFFLSKIPVYPGKRDNKISPEKAAAQDEFVIKAAFCPKFLTVLISYIIIPLTAVFTVILLLYIILNIGGKFWTNNLLEPMLVSYAITVISVYILSSKLQNKFAVWFRLIFPKVLIPIVLFQLTSSIISLNFTGITHTRYYAILFGIFAAASGIILSIVPVRKNGIIAAMLIVFSIVSVIPPIDAFTVSRLSQINMLKSTLTQNEMLKNNKIKPNASISEKDKNKITLSVEYLDKMQYTDTIKWMPDDFDVYRDFYSTFGFNKYKIPKTEDRSIDVFLNQQSPINIAGYDILLKAYISPDENTEPKISTIKKSDKSYMLLQEKDKDKYNIVLTDENNQELIRFNVDEIFSRYQNYNVEKSELSTKEAAFSSENSKAKLTVMVQNASFDISAKRKFYHAEIYILVKIK